MKASHMLNIDLVLQGLTEICDRYEKTAPTVHEWANGLYIRINEDSDNVRLTEINLAVDLASTSDGTHEPPTVAANRVYKLMSRLGQNTEGHAGF